ncbi:MAG: hypothetical protein AB7E82_15095 [Cyclobacteriaceae bacterium]
MKSYWLYLLLAAVVIAGACSNDNDPEADKANFTRIYDNRLYNASFEPLAIAQTADGGYLTLARRNIPNSNFAGAYIMKTDDLGALVTELALDDSFLHPVGDLMELNGNYYFFCMSSTGFQSQLVEVSAAGELLQVLPVGSSYPLAAAFDNGNFVLLSYDNLSKESIISVVTPTGSIATAQGFTIGAGDAVEEPIINHFIRTGRQYPFQVGKTTSGLYFFNGFYNYTFSLVFSDLSGANPNGVIQGQQDDGGMTTVQQLTGNTFAAARFNFGANYFLPQIGLNTSGISSAVDLGGFTLPELVSNAPVRILKTTINEQPVLIFASNTLSRQIGLFIYDQATGEFLGSKYLGFSNPYEVAQVSPTADGGVVVSGSTFVAGRFQRVCIFKISPAALAEVIWH